MNVTALLRRVFTPRRRVSPDMNDVFLPGFALIFFNQFVGEFQSLPNVDLDRERTADEQQPLQTGGTPAGEPTRDRTKATRDAYDRAKALIDAYKSGPQSLTWGDLYGFERDIVELTTGRLLQERLWSVEKRYLDIETSTDYAEHAKTLPLDIQSAPESDIRARIDTLLREIYRLYTVTDSRERMRRRASRFIIRIMLLFAIMLFGVGLLSYRLQSLSSHRITTIAAVLSAGAVGGFISSQRRVQSVSNRGESVLDLIGLHQLTGTLLAPVTGSVFAAVLFMMFTGNFLSGELFPKIESPGGPVANGMTIEIFSQGTGPSAGADWAKLLVWSFIAGFAERVVPDALDRLISQSSEKKSSS